MDSSNDEDNRIDDSTDEDNFPYDMERYGEFLNSNNRTGSQPVVRTTENENADEDAVVSSSRIDDSSDEDSFPYDMERYGEFLNSNNRNGSQPVVETTENGNADEDAVVSSNVENVGEPAELNVQVSVNEDPNLERPQFDPNEETGASADTEISNSLNISVGRGQTSEQQIDPNNFDLSPTYFPYDIDRFGEFMNFDRNELEPTDGIHEMEDENVAASRNEESITDDVAIPNLSNISVESEQNAGQQSDSNEQDPSPTYFPYDMDRFGEFLDPNYRNVSLRIDEISETNGESAVVSSNEDNEQLVADAVEPANSSDISVEQQSDPNEENLSYTFFQSDYFDDFNNNISDDLYFKNDMPNEQRSDGSQQTSVNPKNEAGDVDVTHNEDDATDNIANVAVLNNGVSSVSDDNISKEYGFLHNLYPNPSNSNDLDDWIKSLLLTLD